MSSIGCVPVTTPSKAHVLSPKSNKPISLSVINLEAAQQKRVERQLLRKKTTSFHQDGKIQPTCCKSLCMHKFRCGRLSVDIPENSTDDGDNNVPETKLCLGFVVSYMSTQHTI